MRLLLLLAAAVANKHEKKHKHHGAAEYGDIDAAKAGGAWAPRRPTFGAAGVFVEGLAEQTAGRLRSGPEAVPVRAVPREVPAKGA